MAPTSSRPADRLSRSADGLRPAGRRGHGDEDDRPAVSALRPFDQGSPGGGRRGAVVVCRVWVGTVAAGRSSRTTSVVGTVGSGAVSPITVVLAALLASLVHQIAPAEAITATTRARSEGQTQSPGYQRRRRCQPLAASGRPRRRARAARTRGSTPGGTRRLRRSAGRSCRSGSRLPSAGGRQRRRRRAHRPAPCPRVARTPARQASRSCCRTARRPGGAPHRAHATTGRGPAGRAVLAEVRAPRERRTAHSQRGPRDVAAERSASISSMRSSSEASTAAVRSPARRETSSRRNIS